MDTNLWTSAFKIIALIFTITVTVAYGDKCFHNSDCPAYATCRRDYCECRYGGAAYDYQGKISQCRSFTSEYPAVIPSVVAVILLLLLAGAGVGVWFYLRRKRRLRQDRTPTAWVTQTPYNSRDMGDVSYSSSSKPKKQYQSIPMDPPAHMG